jgi:transmembrane sensor
VIPRTARAEAAAWLARLQSDDPTPQDRAACEAWLAASETNRRALAEVTAAWESAGGLNDLARLSRFAEAGVSGPDPQTHNSQARRDMQSVGRRAVLAGGVGGAVMLAAWSLTAPKTYATGIGETRKVRLSDGSEAMLDACSRVREDFGRSVRRLELQRGRVALTLAQDANRPFVVAGAERRVVALGRSLEVSCLDNGFSVTAMDGLVVVQATGQEPVRLEGGQRLRVAQGAKATTDRPVMEMETAWQSGRLVFADEALSTAVAEINRYNQRPVVLGDAAVARLRVSGSYRAQAGDAFARSVATLFGLEVVAEPHRLLLRKMSQA